MRNCKDSVSSQKGFTLIELVIVMAVALILLGIATISLGNVQRTTQVSSVTQTLISDLREQQIKAMAGDTELSGANADYGVHFETNAYTLFRDTYGTGNFTVNLPETIQVSSTFSGSKVTFEKGSGEVSEYDDVNPANNTITLTNTVSNEQQIITLNRYGVVEDVQ
jgi:prepilin-type N-terminal cleavage/methylation domain-containing protein